MSYDFFNPTDLAFGQKLTAAFISLNNLANAAASNLEDVYKNQEFYADYIGKNYPVSKPRKLGDPCRTDELYNLVNDHFMRITNLKKNDDGKLFIEAHLFNQRTNRMTHLTGTTDLEEGYIYYSEANSVIKPDKPFLRHKRRLHHHRRSRCQKNQARRAEKKCRNGASGHAPLHRYGT